MRRREVENENGNRLIYYEFDETPGDEAPEGDGGAEDGGAAGSERAGGAAGDR